ncbi:MAG TPA: hypothetical protein VG838_07960 [Opitutaceae bacterium]|nr:hypothetical protein [Opitutaceae bacterium]
MYESRQAPLLPRPAFYARLRWHALLGGLVLAACLGVGMAGYHLFEGLGWVDAFVNASMILSGMGPLDPIKSTGGKIFAGAYSLFSGVVFLTTVGFFLLPIIHRFLHKFHLESTRSRS